MKKTLANISSKKWSALLITLFVTIIISIIAIYLLDKIVPFSRDVKWIENGNIAYYNWYTWIEQSLLAMSWADPALEVSSDTHMATVSGYTSQISATWSQIPRSWEWNSEYSTWDWNKIWPWKPLQLVINKYIDWTKVDFYFRVPDLNQDWIYNEILTWTLDNTGIINWILSGKNASWSWVSLYASWESDMITWLETKWLVINWTTGLGSRHWLDLNWSSNTFQTFSDNLLCDNADKKCILKLSVVTPLLLSSWKFAPYLEYKIVITDNKTIPLQYAKIESDGYSFGFKKHIRRDVGQITSNEALDFTVFQ